MSIRRLLNRTVTILPMNVISVDRYGNELRSAGTPVPDIPARRHQVAAGEEITDRDEQSRTFEYFFLPDVTITGRDRIVDGDDTLEVLGPPELVARRRRPHHIELRAYQIEG